MRVRVRVKVRLGLGAENGGHQRTGQTHSPGSGRLGLVLCIALAQGFGVRMVPGVGWDVNGPWQAPLCWNGKRNGPCQAPSCWKGNKWALSGSILVIEEKGKGCRKGLFNGKAM